jgi:hypothetical protein
MSINQDTVTKKTFDALKLVLRDLRVLDEKLGAPLKSKIREIKQRDFSKVSL